MQGILAHLLRSHGCKYTGLLFKSPALMYQAALLLLQPQPSTPASLTPHTLSELAPISMRSVTCPSPPAATAPHSPHQIQTDCFAASVRYSKERYHAPGRPAPTVAAAPHTQYLKPHARSFTANAHYHEMGFTYQLPPSSSWPHSAAPQPRTTTRPQAGGTQSIRWSKVNRTRPSNTGDKLFNAPHPQAGGSKEKNLGSVRLSSKERSF